jgi:hypothetical protein
MSLLNHADNSHVVNTTKVSNVPTDPDNVYLDVIMTNVLGNLTPAVPINYTENRTNAIVTNTGDYNVSVVRFSLESQTLPVFIPVIQPNQGNRDLTTYQITMKITPVGSPAGTIFTQQQPLIWSPQNLNALPPPPPNATGTGYQATFNDYYYSYNFDWFAIRIQETLEQCITNLDSQLTTAGYTDLNGIYSPTFVFDPTTLSFVIGAEQSTFSVNQPYPNASTPNPNACQLYFNTQLYNLLSTFPSVNYGTGPNITDGANYRILFHDFVGSNLVLVPTLTSTSQPTQQNFIQSFQEFSTINNITPVSGIVFTSSQLPIVPNQLSAPQVISEGSSVQALSGNNANFGLILTDLESGDLVYKPNLQYNPTAEYRRISMTGSGALTNIQISVYWRTKLGELIPMTLAGGSSCTIKLLFTKVSAIYNTGKDQIKDSLIGEQDDEDQNKPISGGRRNGRLPLRGGTLRF